MPGIPGAQVPSEIRRCEVEGKMTEWRRYNRQLRKDGTTLYQWRCRSCLNRSDRASKERLEQDRRVFAGEEKVKATPTEKRVWNIWVELTGRPDTDRPNSRFLEAYRAATKGEGYDRKLSRAEVESVVAAAATHRPVRNDPLDVRRLSNAITAASRSGELPESSGRVYSFPELQTS